MRVLYHIRRLEVGGSIINMVNLACAMARRGHTVAVIAEEGPVAASLQAQGIALYEFSQTNVSHPSNRCANEITEAVCQFRPDLVHSFEDSIQGIIELQTARLLTKVPVVWSYMGNHIFSEFHHPRAQLSTVAVPQLLDEAVRRHRWFAQSLCLWNARIDETLVWPSIDTATREELTGGMPGAVVVISPARMDRSAKLHYLRLLIAAFKRLTSENARLALIGGGPAAEELRVVAGDDKRILFIPQKVDIYRYYRAGDVVAAQGSTLLWGMLHGKPVVSIGLNGAVALVSPESLGTQEYLHFYDHRVRTDGVEQLSALLAGLVADRAKRDRLGEWGRMYAQKFTLAVGATEMEGLYQQCLSLRIAESLIRRERLYAVLSLQRFRLVRRLKLALSWVGLGNRAGLRPVIRIDYEGGA